MIFNSIVFAVFLPIVFLIYWICPARCRSVFLLAASFYFYMYADRRYALFLLFAISVSFFSALFIQVSHSGILKKIYLLAGIFLLAGCLILLKYPDFFSETAGPASPAIQFMLPVGISFYTFQTLGYLIDIYNGKYPAERNFVRYCLFVSFFPQLLSGPIGRGDSLLPQFREPRAFDPAQASYGLKLMAVGYFKKLVVAELLAPTVSNIYDNPDSYAGLVFIIATVMFAIQIYCDFSGYTDIAIGCAGLFGIQLQKNFKSPYFSCSIREFWSRWHISLSSWFRDYIYIPLGGNRKGTLRRCLNLMLTFLISGLWHGASLSFLVWGGIHGIYQIMETTVFRKRSRIPQDIPSRRNKVLSRCRMFFLRYGMFFLRLITFGAVCFAWVFFRANTLEDAWRIISLSFYGIGSFSDYLKSAVISLDMSYAYMAYLCIFILLLALYDYASLKTDVIAFISSKKPWVRYPVYILFLLVILLFSEKGVSTEFYYFQF